MHKVFPGEESPAAARPNDEILRLARLPTLRSLGNLRKAYNLNSTPEIRVSPPESYRAAAEL